MQTRIRIPLAALTSDLALYLIMLSLPYRVLALGAHSLALGLVPLAYAGPYSVTAMVAGRFSDRWPRRGPIRVGLTLAILGALWLSQVSTFPLILAGTSILGIGLGFFWPSIQAGTSEVAAGAALGRDTRLLNMGWSAGKGLGMLAGGWLLPRLGGEGLALVGAAAWVACWIAVPSMPRPGSHQESVETDVRRPWPARQRAFLWAGWIGNGVAFAVAATLNHHLPRLLQAGGIESARFGVFLGCVFLAQTATFFVLGSLRWWHYRLLPFLGMQAVLALAIFATPSVDGFSGLLMLAPVFGLCLGFLYQSSLYYSLHAPEGRGAQAGVHEASLGLTGATVPLIGGLAVAGRHLDAPFVVATLAVGLSILLASFWMARSRTQGMAGPSVTTAP